MAASSLTISCPSLIYLGAVFIEDIFRNFSCTLSPTCCQQSCVRPLFHDLTGLHYQDEVGVANRGQAVRNDK